jgi:hypothetical protein
MPAPVPSTHGALQSNQPNLSRFFKACYETKDGEKTRHRISKESKRPKAVKGSFVFRFAFWLLLATP